MKLFRAWKRRLAAALLATTVFLPAAPFVPQAEAASNTDVFTALAGVLGGGNPDNPITALLNSEKGGEIVNAVVGMVGGFISKKLAEKQGGEQKEEEK